MNLNTIANKMEFDIAEGEEDIVGKLYRAYEESASDAEFVYRNRKYIEMVDESRIEQFIQMIGESKRFSLKALHEAFQK